MNPQQDEIKSWFRNCLSVQMDQNGIIPLRFTLAQIEHYERIGKSMRSWCPAGVCLDVVTDSDVLTINCMVTGNTRNYCYMDLFMDKTYIQSVGSDHFDSGEISFHFQLPGEGLRRVTVYLPHNVQMWIQQVVWSKEAIVKPILEEKGYLLCCGDSITQGMDAHYPSFTYPVLLSHTLDKRIINQGVGGHYFDEASLVQLSLPAPDAIIVAYGTNDWGKWSAPKEMEKHCTAFFEKLHDMYPQSPILALTPLWRRAEDRELSTGTLEQVREIIRGACITLGIHAIDGRAVLPHQESFFADGLHPVDEGFTKIASYLSDQLSSVLNKNG